MGKISKEKVVGYLKAGSELVSSCGAQALACGVCRAILPPGLSIVVKGGVMLGGLILGSFVGDKLNDYVDEQIDSAVKNVDDTISEVKRCVDVIQDKDEETKPENEEGA